MLFNYYFLRDILKGNLSLEDADEEQSQIANEAKDIKTFFKELWISYYCNRKNYKYFEKRNISNKKFIKKENHFL